MQHKYTVEKDTTAVKRCDILQINLSKICRNNLIQVKQCTCIMYNNNNNNSNVLVNIFYNKTAYQLCNNCNKQPNFFSLQCRVPLE